MQMPACLHRGHPQAIVPAEAGRCRARARGRRCSRRSFLVRRAPVRGKEEEL